MKGFSTLDISKLLHEKRVYIATDYRKFKKTISENNEPIRIWKPTTILQVFNKRAYTGTLIQGRNQKHLYEGKKREALDKEHWTVTENAYETIISIDIFNKVQEKITSKVNRNSIDKKAIDDTVFRDKVYCNIYKRKMSTYRHLSGKKTFFYFSYNCFGKYSTEKCGTSITEVTLKKTVKAAFNIILSNKGNSYKEYLNSYDYLKKALNKHKEKALTEIERKISRFNRIQSEYYEKYVLGQWSKVDFENEKEGLNQKKSELENEKKDSIFEEETVSCIMKLNK